MAPLARWKMYALFLLNWIVVTANIWRLRPGWKGWVSSQMMRRLPPLDVLTGRSRESGTSSSNVPLRYKMSQPKRSRSVTAPSCNHNYGDWKHEPVRIDGKMTDRQFWQRICRECGFVQTITRTMK